MGLTSVHRHGDLHVDFANQYHTAISSADHHVGCSVHDSSDVE